MIHLNMYIEHVKKQYLFTAAIKILKKPKFFKNILH